MNRLTIPNQEPSRIAAAYERRKRSIVSGRYSLFERGNLFRIHEMESRILAQLRKYEFAPLHEKQILEIGCGSGFWLRRLIQWGARPEKLSGIDLLADRIAEARRLSPIGIDLQCGNASQLPYSGGSFDLVLQSTVFTSILDPLMKRQVAREMLRVLRPGGYVLWYDFFVNNPRNPDVHGIGKREIRDLFPRCSITFQRLTLAPPLGRRIGSYSSFIYYLLSCVRLFCTHYLAFVLKRE